MSAVWVQLASPEHTDLVLAALREHGVEAAPAPPSRPAALAVVVCDAPGSREALASLVAALATEWPSAPAVVVLASSRVSYPRAEALLAGADDLQPEPLDAREIAATVVALVRRRERDRDAHPLTGLPGGAALHRDLCAHLARRDAFALIALDMRDFKSYNDRYGFVRGDGVIRFVANLLEAVADTREIVYHLGGDEFLATAAPERAEEFARCAIAGFDRTIGDHYDPDDRAAGCITGRVRATGEVVRHPIVGLTVSIATSLPDDIHHAGQLAQVLAELKQYARREPGSTWARDRRQVHDTERSLRIRDEREGG